MNGICAMPVRALATGGKNGHKSARDLSVFWGDLVSFNDIYSNSFYGLMQTKYLYANERTDWAQDT